MAHKITDRARRDGPASSAVSDRTAAPEVLIVADERAHWGFRPAMPAPADAPGNVPANPLADAPPAVRGPFGRRHVLAKLGHDGLAFWRRQWADELAYGTGFVLVPVFFAGGALAYWALPVEPALHNIAAAIAAMVGVLLAVVRMGFSQPIRAVVAIGLIVLMGMGAAQWRTHAVGTQMLGGGVTSVVTARIVQVEARDDGSQRLTLDIVQTSQPTLRYAPARVRLTTRKPVAGARAGAMIEGRASLRGASGPFRPGGFDFAFHAYFQKIGAYGFFLGAPTVLEKAAPQPRLSLADSVNNARQWLGNRVRQIGGDSPQGAISAALITGEKTPIPEADAETLRLSGLAHILSISGLHMALVAGTVMGALRAGVALAPAFAARYPIKKYAAGAALITVAGYLFIAGASVATQRSFLMLGIMLGAVLLDRAAVTMRNLAIAALLVLFIAPETIAGPSFQMSFAATAALIALYSGWSARRWQHDPQASGWAWRAVAQKSGGYIAGLAMTSLVAGMATGLFAVYHFHRIATLGLLANLLAVPIVSIITMPLAIIGVLMIPFGVDGFVFKAMIVSVDWMVNIARMVVDLSPGSTVGEMPLPSLLSGSLCLLCLTLLRSHLKWFGLVFLLLAGLFWQAHDEPVMLISEDARQMGLVRVTPVDGTRRLAVNRERPNGFTLEQWMPAFRIGDIIKPLDGAAATDGDGAAMGAMRCAQGACVAHLDAAARTVIYLEKRPLRGDAEAWQKLCAAHAVIVHAYAPSRSHCAGDTIEITAQQLALRGAAAIYHRPKNDSYTVRYALGETLRPWQTQRQFSRAARNLSPYYRPPKDAAEKPTSEPGK